MNQEFAYESMPYTNHVFAQTHPDLLCTSARIFGFNAPDLQGSRVLELGCGNGMNLIAQAYSLPEAEFVGVDLGQRHIDYAKDSVAELGLKNIEFRQADIMEMTAKEYGEFGYIIGHGLISWVPDFVREKTFSIFSEMLSPNGVGYLSYNTYPGRHFQQLVSEILKLHTHDIDAPVEKVRVAKEFLKFIGDNTPKDDLFKFAIQNESLNFENKDDIAIFHDNLSEVNHPFYFHEFVKTLEENGLQFLSEAELFSMAFNELTPEAQKLIEGITDPIWQQQYRDFLTGRSFRQTLFCRSEIKLKRDPGPEVLETLFLASPAQTAMENPDSFSDQPVEFKGLGFATIQINHPLTKTALLQLQKIWGDSIGYRELIEKSKEKMNDAGVAPVDWSEHEQIANNLLLQLILRTDLIEAHSYRPEICREISEKPKVNKFSSWQLQKGELITGAYGRTIKIEDEILRRRLESLDGTRDLRDVLNEINESLNEVENVKVDDSKSASDILDQHLDQFAKIGLFEK